jgi:ribosomal protein S18 acetylase RimI-like enzyme
LRQPFYVARGVCAELRLLRVAKLWSAKMHHKPLADAHDVEAEIGTQRRHVQRRRPMGIARALWRAAVAPLKALGAQRVQDRVHWLHDPSSRWRSRIPP